MTTKPISVFLNAHALIFMEHHLAFGYATDAIIHFEMLPGITL